jgi:hypothetical protein
MKMLDLKGQPAVCGFTLLIAGLDPQQAACWVDRSIGCDQA